MTNTDCPQNEACNNEKCVDPCPGTCGLNAKCQTVSHKPICLCFHGYTGNPLRLCSRIGIILQSFFAISILNSRFLVTDQMTPPLQDPCHPSPCGLFAFCVDKNGQASCSCSPDMSGSAPNCKPECTSNSDCSSTLVCLNQKCKDPCPGSCSNDALCTVSNHIVYCTCPESYTGDPFSRCYRIQQSKNGRLKLFLTEFYKFKF